MLPVKGSQAGIQVVEGLFFFLQGRGANPQFGEEPEAEAAGGLPLDKDKDAPGCSSALPRASQPRQGIYTGGVTV